MVLVRVTVSVKTGGNSSRLRFLVAIVMIDIFNIIFVDYFEYSFPFVGNLFYCGIVSARKILVGDIYCYNVRIFWRGLRASVLGSEKK